MAGDDLKKVNPGDPLRIPARTYNRFIDAARAQQEGRRLFGRNALPAGRDVCIVPARNDSDEGAPVRGAVSIVGVSSGIVRFVKPDGPPYGIALEPVGVGAVGRVAVSGGPYELLVTGDFGIGQRLAPTSGEWSAGPVYDGPLMALSVPDAHRCWCIFAPGGGGIEIRDDDPPPEDLFEGRVWYNRSVTL